MDNRLKFLYCLITELWGHMFRSRAGKGSPVQAEVIGGRQTPHKREDCDAERRKVAKSDENVSRKAAIVYKVPVP